MRFLPLLLILLLVGCSDEESQPVEENKQEENSQEAIKPSGVEVVMKNLSAPWSIDKQGETIYISERTGSVVRWQEGEMIRQKVRLKMPLSDAPEAGLLGFVLSPSFQETNTAYAYYTYESNEKTWNRVIELKLINDSWVEDSILLDEIPDGIYHHGGRLKIGPDEKLYITTGDAKVLDIAQDVHSLGGKILRMNLDGSIPNDNPIPNSYVYSYGHRNPQGLTWDEQGQLYSSEHGESSHDELNRIEPGKNYGWPVIEADQKKNGMETPLIYASGETWAPSGMAYKNNKLYVATLRGEAVKEYGLKTREMKNIASDVGRIRDVYIAGQYLYYISNNTDGRGNPSAEDDKLYRVFIE